MSEWIECAEFLSPKRYAESKRIPLEDTCQRDPALWVRKGSPDSVLVQIWTKEGAKHIRMTNATLTKQECLSLSRVLVELSESIK